MATKGRTRGEANRLVAGELKAERMRQKINDSTLTQVELSRRTSIPKDTIKSIESGRAQVDVDQMFAIAEALGIKASEIARRAEDQMESSRRVKGSESTGRPTINTRLRRKVGGQQDVDEPQGLRTDR